jgi:hypothetical protein
MCGSTENLAIEAASLRGMLSSPVFLPDGKSYAYAHDYLVVNPAAPTPLSRSMLALMVLQQIAPNSELRALLDRMAQDHVRTAQRKGETLFYADPPPSNGESRIGVLGNAFQVFVNGCAIRALSRWSSLEDDRRYLDTAGRLARFALEERLTRTFTRIAPRNRLRLLRSRRLAQCGRIYPLAHRKVARRRDWF